MNCRSHKFSAFLLFALLALSSTLWAVEVISIATCPEVSESGYVPIGSTNRFSTETPKIHAVVVLKEVEPFTKVKCSWLAVDAYQTANSEIYASDVDVNDSNARLQFAIKRPKKGWRAGNYRIDLYIDKKIAETVAFEIVSEPDQPSNWSGQDNASSSLLGSWECQVEFGVISLLFQTEKELLFDGDPVKYSLRPGIIRIDDGKGIQDYPYWLEGDVLRLSFPAGFQLEFARIESNPAIAEEDSESAESEIDDADWGFKFTPPKGWKAEKGSRGAMLAHNSIAGMILVFPHLKTDFEEMRAQMEAGFSEEGFRLSLTDSLHAVSNNAIGGDYQGVFEKKQVKGRVIGTFSVYSNGAYVMALAAPDKFNRQLSQAADSIVEQMKYFKLSESE